MLKHHLKKKKIKAKFGSHGHEFNSWLVVGSDYELRTIQDLTLEGVALENKTLCGTGFQPISNDTACYVIREKWHFNELHSRTVFSFVIVALFILLHDHRISVFWLGVQSFIQFYFLYVRRHALDYYFPKHVYSVVRSPSQCKELLENFRSYYNCRRFGVLLTPGVKIRRKSRL